MCYFQPPQPNESWQFVSYSILGHSIGFHVFRAYLLLHLNSRFNQNYDELREVTYIFDTVYYIFFIIGAVILERVTNKFSSILLTLAGIIVAQFIFYMSHITFLTEATYVFVAGLSGILKTGLIAYGATEYTGANCLNVSTYFGINYIVEMIGYFMALRFVKLHMLIENKCGSFTCTSYVMVVSMVFEIFAWIAFSFGNSTGTKISKVPISTELTKLGRILFVFTPFLVVWFNYGDGVWRWIAQAKFMNCKFLWYKLSYNDMLTLNQIAIILCGILYQLLTYFKFIVRRPALIIGFGGILMSTAILLSSYNYEALKEYDQPKYSNNITRIYMGGSCVIPFYNMNNTAFKLFIKSNKFYFPNLDLRTFDWNLEANFTCLRVTIEYQIIAETGELLPSNVSHELCFQEKSSNMVTIGCYPDGKAFYTCLLYTQPFDDCRDVFGRPKLCIFSTIVTKHFNYHIKFQSSNNPNARYEQLTRDDLSCREIQEGQYDFIVNFRTLDKNLNFQYGGVYLVFIDGLNSYQIIIIRQPLNIPIWLLLVIIYLAAFGQNCIIVTGMYVIYTQSPINVRTIAVGCWWMFVDSGNFVFTISSDTDYVPNEMTSFMFTSKLIGAMTILFILTYMCYGQWNFKCDTTPVINDIAEEGIAGPSELPLPLQSSNQNTNKSRITVELRHKSS